MLCYIYRQIYRRPFSSLVIFIIILFLHAAVSKLNNGIMENQIQLKQMQEDFKIKFAVSDNRGRKVDGLKIPSTYIDLFTNDYYEISKYIDNICLKRTYYYEVDEDVIIHINREPNKMIGINRIQASDELHRINGVSVRFGNGYEESLLNSSQPVCIINEELLQVMNKKTSDIIALRIYNDEKIKDKDDYVDMEFEIIGIIQGGSINNIYCSYDSIKDVNDTISGGYNYSELLTGEFNKAVELKQLKDLAEDYFVKSNMSTSKNEHEFSFIIYDADYMETAANITYNIKYYDILKTVLFMVIIFMGFFLGYLLLKGRKNEIAMMRSLGTSRKKVIIMLITEQLIIVFAASAAEIIIEMLVQGDILVKNIEDIVFTLLFYISGSVIAIVNIIRKPIIKLIKKDD